MHVLQESFLVNNREHFRLIVQYYKSRIESRIESITSSTRDVWYTLATTACIGSFVEYTIHLLEAKSNSKLGWRRVESTARHQVQDSSNRTLPPGTCSDRRLPPVRKRPDR